MQVENKQWRTESRGSAVGCRTQSRASLVLLHQIHFYDRLMNDLGMEKKRKNNLLLGRFMPYESLDYNGVLTALEEERAVSATLRGEIHTTLPGKV
jgi:hypothetical protein